MALVFLAVHGGDGDDGPTAGLLKLMVGVLMALNFGCTLELA